MGRAPGAKSGYKVNAGEMAGWPSRGGGGCRHKVTAAPGHNHGGTQPGDSSVTAWADAVNTPGMSLKGTLPAAGLKKQKAQGTSKEQSSITDP